MTHTSINRQELNRRFKEVYQLLARDGFIVKSDRKRSKTAFAEKLGTKDTLSISIFKKND